MDEQQQQQQKYDYFDVLDTNFLQLPDTPVFNGANSPLVPFNHMSPLFVATTNNNNNSYNSNHTNKLMNMPQLELKVDAVPIVVHEQQYHHQVLAPPVITHIPAPSSSASSSITTITDDRTSNKRKLTTSDNRSSPSSLAEDVDDDNDDDDDDDDDDDADDGDDNHNQKKKKTKTTTTTKKRSRGRSNGDETVDEKTARRRARERENARRCRERKQKRMKELEAKLVELKQEREELKEKQALSRIEQWLHHYDELMTRVAAEVDQAAANGDELDEEVICSLLLDLKQSTKQINQIIGYNAKLMPLYLEMAHFRNIILWLYVTPMNSMLSRLNAQLEHGTTAMPLEKDERVDAITSSNLDMVQRIKGQLQDEVQFSRQQLQSIVDFRGQWFEQIVNTFKSNQKVLQILQEMHTTQTHSSIVEYHNMVEELEKHFGTILTPEQHARSIHWFNQNGNQLEGLLLDGTLSRLKNKFVSNMASASSKK